MLPVHNMTAKILRIEEVLKMLSCLADIRLIGLARAPHMLQEGAHRLVSPETGSRKCAHACGGLGDSAGSSQKQPVKGCSTYWKCSGVISPGRSFRVGSQAGRLLSGALTEAGCRGRGLCFSSSASWTQSEQPVPWWCVSLGMRAGVFASSWRLRGNVFCKGKVNCFLGKS